MFRHHHIDCPRKAEGRACGKNSHSYDRNRFHPHPAFAFWYNMKATPAQRIDALSVLKFAIPVIAALIPATARAELRLCNQSFDVLNVALAQPQGAAFRSRGWWRIAPNQCATLLRETLHDRYYYVFAADVFGKAVLSGSVPMCVAPQRFETDDQNDCLLRGFLDARFIEVDTGDQANWTVFVAPRPG